MPRGKALTKQGHCLSCGAAVAWREVNGWHLYNAQLDERLEPIRAKGVFVPGTERHSCEGYKQAVAHRAGRSEATATQATATVESQAEATATVARIDEDALIRKLRGEVVETLRGFGIVQKTSLEVRHPNGTTVEVDGPAHPRLREVILYLSAGQPVYLHGPAGSGKTYGGIQAGKALGREVIIDTLPGATVGKLLGFVDAGGRQVETPFSRAFTEGCVYVADEFDRSIPAVAAAFNSALANRQYTIGTRTVTAHENFAFVATGNTDMRGATRQFTAAQPLDLATAARFAFIHWGYDEELETRIVTGILPSAKPLLDWGRMIRVALDRDQIDTVWSGPREMEKIARALVSGHSLRDAVDSWIWRGFPQDAVRRYEREFPLPKVS